MLSNIWNRLKKDETTALPRGSVMVYHYRETPDKDSNNKFLPPTVGDKLVLKIEKEPEIAGSGAKVFIQNMLSNIPFDMIYVSINKYLDGENIIGNSKMLLETLKESEPFYKVKVGYAEMMNEWGRNIGNTSIVYKYILIDANEKENALSFLYKHEIKVECLGDANEVLTKYVLTQEEYDDYKTQSF